MTKKKKSNVILGDGITGYVIAACLDYLGEDFTIYGNGKYKAPEILLLKTNLDNFSDTSDDVANRYFEIFNIKDREEYLSQVNIGFMTADSHTTFYPTKSALRDYYTKQGRKKSKSSMSDGKQSFIGIELKKVYPLLVNKYKDKFVKTEITRDTLEELSSQGNINIYNTIFETNSNNFQPTFEYVVKEENAMTATYIYDCRYYTDIKRFTPHYTEYFKAPINKEYFTIKNYYESPQIYVSNNTKNNTIIYDISRNATKTQLKIEDIIKFLLKL